MKKYALVSILVSLIGGWTAAPAALGATRTLEITKGVLLDKTGFSLSFSLSGARVVIRHINDDDTVVKADITYNTPPQGKMREPKLLTTSVGNTFIAEFKSGMRVLPYTNSTIEKWTLPLETMMWIPNSSWYAKTHPPTWTWGDCPSSGAL